MKFLSILIFLFIVISCGTSKKSSDSSDAVLFHGYSSELNGDLDVLLKNSSKVNCAANIIQINCSQIAPQELILKAKNGEVTLKLLDEKSYYFTPNCNDKSVKLLVYKKGVPNDLLIQTVDIKVTKK